MLLIEWDNSRIPRCLSKELHLLCCQTFTVPQKSIYYLHKRFCDSSKELSVRILNSKHVAPNTVGRKESDKRRARTLEILYLNTLVLLCINHSITYSHRRRFNIFIYSEKDNSLLFIRAHVPNTKTYQPVQSERSQTKEVRGILKFFT